MRRRKSRKFRLFRKPVVEFSSVFLLYFFCSLAAFRVLLLRLGTIGHNWDWSIPPTAYHLADMASNSLYTWGQQFLGFSYEYANNILIFNYVLGLVGYLGLTGAFVSKFLLIFTVVTSGCSMFYLVKDVLTSEIFLDTHQNTKNMVAIFSSLIAGYLYSLSPFLFNEFVGGSIPAFVAYSFAPLVVLFYRRCCNPSLNFGYVILAAITYSVVAISLQTLILLFGVMFLYALFFRGKKGLLALALILIIWLLINGYWVLPLLFQTKDVIRVALITPLESLLLNIRTHTPNLLQAFTLTGYWTDFFTNTIPSSLYRFWIIAPFTIVVAMFSMLILHPKKQLLFWSLLALMSFIIVTGSQPPLGKLVVWLFTNIPIMVLFRSPQHLIFLPVFCYAILLGLTIGFIGTHFNKKNFIAVGAAFFILTSIWIAPFYTGNLGGSVDVFELSPGYEHINQIIDETKDQEDYRVLYLPMAGSPYYLKTEYQSEGQGGDPIVAHSIRPSVIADFPIKPHVKQFSASLEDAFSRKDPPINASKLLGQANVKYIILREDIRPNFGPFARTWNYTQVYNNLKQINGIRLVKKYQYVSLWENQYFIPRIYAIPRPRLISSVIDKMSQVVTSDNFAVRESAVFLTNNLD